MISQWIIIRICWHDGSIKVWLWALGLLIIVLGIALQSRFGNLHGLDVLQYLRWSTFSLQKILSERTIIH
ncbi:MAG: hypothetical protein CMJ80_16735 [Planctomycetaceae bacterium]|nr:hypothetical protein [Planctomycetaceae bacterium]